MLAFATDPVAPIFWIVFWTCAILVPIAIGLWLWFWVLLFFGEPKSWRRARRSP